MCEYEKGLVSIVVPTYFSEKYLDLCLHCIVNQTYPKIEVIVCDGSSEDRTVEIIEKYEKAYDFVRCIHKENKGVSDSRNVGMSAAKGEYLEFVDSDDFLLPKACETLVKEIERTQADVVIAGFRIMKTGEERKPLSGVYEGGKEFAAHLENYYFYKRNCMNTPWNKLYRRETLKAHFPEELSMGEDLLFNLQVYDAAGRIAVIPDLVYEYNNVNDESLAYRYRENGFEIETMLHESMMEFAEKYGRQDKTVLYRNYIFGIKTKMTALVHRSGLSERDCKRKIDQWISCPAVKEMLDSYTPEGRKDRILFYFMRHHKKMILYWYYRIMG